MQPQKKMPAVQSPESLVCGVFSKREAAAQIATGVRHLHSSPPGLTDVSAQITREALESRVLRPYPWEQSVPLHESVLTASANRQQAIGEVIQRLGVSGKRDLKEKLESLLEELVTNAMYHAYQKADGSPRYARRNPVVLSDAEKISLRFGASKEGIFLSVTDQGGTFQFSQVASSFGRCYGSSEKQIEAKEGGAGLGLYMSYEVLTHLKIVALAGRETSISCWLADKSSDPRVFSFNFFEWR